MNAQFVLDEAVRQSRKGWAGAAAATRHNRPRSSLGPIYDRALHLQVRSLVWQPVWFLRRVAQ